MKTTQMQQWAGEFGREYTDRNSLSLGELDSLYTRNYGATRTDLNSRFLGDLPHDAPILEVGCNIGNQLLLLQHMGFTRLSGIEVQPYALDQARSRLPGVELVEGNAFHLPFPDRHFQVVFTSGVLIHIAPEDLPRATAEIHRCSNQYIWGLEYYSPEAKSVSYRGQTGLLWKMDYAQAYLNQFDDLDLVRTEQLPYLTDSNVDRMFLLKKKNMA